MPYERQLCPCDEPECVALRGAYEPVEGKPGWYWLPLPGPSPEQAGESAPVNATADVQTAEVSEDTPESSDVPEHVQAPPAPAREMTADERRSWNAAIERQMHVNSILNR